MLVLGLARSSYQIAWKSTGLVGCNPRFYRYVPPTPGGASNCEADQTVPSEVPSEYLILAVPSDPSAHTTTDLPSSGLTAIAGIELSLQMPQPALSGGQLALL